MPLLRGQVRCQAGLEEGVVPEVPLQGVWTLVQRQVGYRPRLLEAPSEGVVLRRLPDAVEGERQGAG